MPKNTAKEGPSSSGSAFPMEELESMFKGIVGTGSADKDNKAAQQLAKLQGEIQKQLAKQNNEYQLALQQQQQGWQTQWNAAELTGNYNGQQTLAGKQQQQGKYEFDVTARQQEDMNTLARDMQQREVALAELNSERENAIAQGNLQLAREIQTREVALREEIDRGNLALEQMQTSGYMSNGQLTEDARARRVEEALKRAEVSGMYTDPDTGQVMGVTEARRQAEAELALKNTQTMGRDANGNLTDAGQQWRVTAGLDYAQTAAKLAQSPEDYFESAAFMRNAGQTGALGFLNDINQQGLGSNVGFRSAGGNLPQVNSMTNLASGGMGTRPDTAPPGGFQRTTVGPGQVPVPAFAQSDVMYAGGTPEQSGGNTEQRQAWAALDPVTQQKYRDAGGAPSFATEGPSASLSQAQNVNAGVAQPYQSSMYKEPLAMNAQRDIPVPGFMAAGAGQSPAIVNTQSAMPPRAPVDEAAQRLAAFKPVFQRGAHKLGPGALAAMSPTERGLFSSAAKASGVNPADFEQANKRAFSMNTETASRA